MAIHAGEKVTICGRTGSGKSSLILSLLRMVDLQSGGIELDGVNIASIPPNFLRQRCFVTVSQDTLLLHNETLRFNLNPDEYVINDHTIVNTLKRLNVWRHFDPSTTAQPSFQDQNDDKKHPTTPTCPTSSILNRKLSTFPSLSAGQAQLFALCRGILKAEALRTDGGARPVVLLDEITAVLDASADAAVQEVVEAEFVGKGHTVIMVSHRVGVGSARVVRMRDGKLES